MPTVVTMTAAMFPEVCETLLRELDPRMPEERWRLLFVDRGWHGEDHCGYVLRDGTRPVGVLGTLLSERLVEGRLARFCNLHAWYVKPEFRAASLSLMRPVLALGDRTLTDFSASLDVAALSKRLGFRTLDDKLLVLPRLPWPGDRRARITELGDDAGAAERGLNAPDLRIFRDHQGIGCSHLLLESGTGYCYVVSSSIDAGWLPHRQVHYISDRRIFAEHHLAIRAHLLRNRTCYATVGSRLLSGVAIPWSVRVASNELLYRPTASSPAPESIDTLYSELPLLRLRMPFEITRRFRGRLRRLIRKWRRPA